MTINKDTPIAMMTLGQLQEALGLAEKEEKAIEKTTGDKRYVYGIDGIRRLFGGISHVTAHKYKNTFLQEAVSQQGRIIITDVDKALELFKNHKERR
jgi:hypothetical protein